MLALASTPAHPYGWLCLVPPLVAIVLAIATRHVVLSLLAGIFAGAMITTGGNPLAAIPETLETHLWKALVDEDRLRVFAFTLLMGAMVGVIHSSGGMRGLVVLGESWAKTRRGGQLVTWLLGMLIFFDDYANTVLLGNTLRPLTDRLSISREKLAYLVDSTAAPVAGLAIVSTWVAGEIGYVQDGLDKISGQADVNAFRLFVASIPYRFYVLWTLGFVFFVGASGRDFGPMLQAERRAHRGIRPSIPDLSSEEPDGEFQPGRWYNAVIPVAVTVLTVLWLLYRTGIANLSGTPDEGPSLWEIFGEADSYYALVWSSLAGLLSAVALTVTQRLLSWRNIGVAAQGGAAMMLPSLAVLWLASTLSTMTGNKAIDGESAPPYALSYRLYTGEYCSELLTSRPEIAASLNTLGPTIIFVLSAFVSFATGTSWGTMAIVLPMAVPLAYGLIDADQASSAFEHPLMLGSVGSVLAGAIFGDHCSPISDTTVLSSQSSGCDHVAHVWTQLPYAALVGAVTIIFGTLPIGLGVSVWLLLPTGFAVLAAVLWFVGEKVDG